MVLTIRTMTTRSMTCNSDQARKIWEDQSTTERYITGLYQRQVVKYCLECDTMVENDCGCRKVFLHGIWMYILFPLHQNQQVQIYYILT